MRDHDKYQLRPRGPARARARSPRPHRQPQPLSKYRRKTANARERSRMQEINRAFETLRRAVPAAAITGAPVQCEKLTKISTLRLAMRYIAALASMVRQADEVSPPLDQDQDRPSRWPSPFCSGSELSSLSAEAEAELGRDTPPSEYAEDSLSPFDSFFAEFECEYVVERTFA